MYDGVYLNAYFDALVRLHRPQWSWGRMRIVCRCGVDLPCRTLTALSLPPLPNSGHWSDGE
jgi:hypothetical protein